MRTACPLAADQKDPSVFKTIWYLCLKFEFKLIGQPYTTGINSSVVHAKKVNKYE